MASEQVFNRPKAGDTLGDFADRGDQRKLPSVPDAAISIFADCRDWHIKSPILTCQISVIKFAGIRWR